MNPRSSPSAGSSGVAGGQASDITIPQLVAEVYEAVPAPERILLLEPLLKPLGLLSLVAIADGIFAKLLFRHGGSALNIPLEEMQGVKTAQVIALVDHAQQVSAEAVDGLAQVLMASPVMSSSAVAALLVSLLLQRARSRERTAAGVLENPQ